MQALVYICKHNVWNVPVSSCGKFHTQQFELPKRKLARTFAARGSIIGPTSWAIATFDAALSVHTFALAVAPAIV